MQTNSCIYIAGHQGLVGSALMRLLTAKGYTNLITRTIQDLDLRNQEAVTTFFDKERPEYVFIAAARVGGIYANAHFPAVFIYDNLMIQTNLIHAAYTYKVKKLLFLGSSCIYPRDAENPISENALLTGSLEPSNQAYAIAKIAGIAMCQSYNKQYGTRFIAAMPTNLYGPGDTFDAHWSHVVPALMLKMHQAKIMNQETVLLWGDGNARRELLYVDDCAQALFLLMQSYEDDVLINIGTGSDISIAQLALHIQQIVGYTGRIIFDDAALTGVHHKRLNIQKITSLGWQATTSLLHGLQNTYEWFLQYHCPQVKKEMAYHEHR